MTKQLKGYKQAVKKVLAMVQEPDSWMTPTDDEPRERESRKDFGNWLQEEQEGWEETTHFQIRYGTEISDLARSVAEQNNLEGEAWLGIREDLKEVFWNAWADKHDALTFWKKHIQRTPE